MDFLRKFYFVTTRYYSGTRKTHVALQKQACKIGNYIMDESLDEAYLSVTCYNQIACTWDGLYSRLEILCGDNELIATKSN